MSGVGPRFQGTVVTLVVLALGAAALFVMFERVETTVEHPPSLDARLNPHLALVRLMETRGLDVETAPALTSQMLEGRESIIWLSDQRIDLTQRAEDVADWVEAGGRLVVADLGFGDEEDPLITTLARRDSSRGDEDLALLGPYEHEDDGPTLSPAAIPLGTGHLLACSNGDPLAAVGPYGAGRLGVLADLDRYRSDRLEDTRAGPVFWDLVRLMDLPAPILLVYSDSTPGLTDLLWEHARPAVISSLLLLLVWLVHASRRFGPMLPARARAQRSLLEHVAATGSLLWRQGARDVLLDSVRDAVRHRVAVSRADWAFLQAEELAPRLAEVADLPAGDVLAVLTESASPNPTAFARQIHHLQQLRAALGGSS